MVRDVKRVLERGPCTLSQLSAELGVSREIVRSMLHFWIVRGNVELEPGRLESGRLNSTCSTTPCPSCLPGGSAVGPAVYNWR